MTLNEMMEKAFEKSMELAASDLEEEKAKGAEGFENIYDSGAESVMPKAAYERGNCYLRGIGGPKDEAKAQEWFQKASDLGHCEAKKAVGENAARGAAEQGAAAKKAAEDALHGQPFIQFDRGCYCEYFLTNPNTGIIVYEDVYILIHDKVITSSKALLPLAEQIKSGGKPLLIIAEEVRGDALFYLVKSNIQGDIRACAVKAPAFGDRRKETLKDIAIYTGGEVISEEAGHKLENAGISQLGRAKAITIDDQYTTISGGAGKSQDIKDRMARLKTEIAETTSDYDREKKQERLNRLAGGIGEIKISAETGHAERMMPRGLPSINVITHCLSGDAYWSRGMFDQAIEEYTAAIRIDPNHAKAYYGRGEVYFKKGMYDQVISDCEAILRIDPNYYDLYFGGSPEDLLKHARDAKAKE